MELSFQMLFKVDILINVGYFWPYVTIQFAYSNNLNAYQFKEENSYTVRFRSREKIRGILIYRMCI